MVMKFRQREICFSSYSKKYYLGGKLHLGKTQSSLWAWLPHLRQGCLTASWAPDSLVKQEQVRVTQDHWSMTWDTIITASPGLRPQNVVGLLCCRRDCIQKGGFLLSSACVSWELTNPKEHWILGRGRGKQEEWFATIGPVHFHFSCVFSVPATCFSCCLCNRWGGTKCSLPSFMMLECLALWNKVYETHRFLFCLQVHCSYNQRKHLFRYLWYHRHFRGKHRNAVSETPAWCFSPHLLISMLMFQSILQLEGNVLHSFFIGICTEL